MRLVSFDHDILTGFLLCIMYNDVTWTPRHLKSWVTRLFPQQFVQFQNREIIKALHTGHLWVERSCYHIDLLSFKMPSIPNKTTFTKYCLAQWSFEISQVLGMVNCPKFQCCNIWQFYKHPVDIGIKWNFMRTLHGFYYSFVEHRVLIVTSSLIGRAHMWNGPWIWS